MPGIQKFAFDQSFDDGFSSFQAEARQQEPEAPPPPPPEPTVTVVEMERRIAAAEEAAHAAGVQEGFVKGKEAAETGDQRALAAALTAVEGALKTLVSEGRAADAARKEDSARMALAMVRKLFPAMAARHGMAEVETTINGFIAELIEEEKLIIRVHESRLPSLQPNIMEIARRQGFAGDITILSDPRLGPQDVQASWGDGGAERNVAELWAEIERIAGNLLDSLPGGPAAPGRPPGMTP